VVTGSPLNICAHHLKQAAELYASASGHETQTRIRERCPDCNHMTLTATLAPPVVTCRNCGHTHAIATSDIPIRDTKIIETGDPVVYYIRFADRIKIGTTANLPNRLATLPHDEVLAVERGGRDVEKQRHQQFRQYRITPKGEWFRPGEHLMAHIAALPKVPTSHSL
jgi:ribosomal protein S27E